MIRSFTSSLYNAVLMDLTFLRRLIYRPSRILALAWLVLALFHLRPWRLSYGYHYGGDDCVYLAHLSTLVIDRDLDYSNEHTESYLLYPVGSSLLSLPGYMAGYIADLCVHRADRLRESRNYSDTWTIIGYLVNQQILVIFGIVFLFRLLRTEMGLGRLPSVLATLAVMTSHLALYAFRRPMAHDGQFFASALFYLWYFRRVQGRPATFADIIPGAVLAGIVMTTRWDNAPLAILGSTVFALQLLRGREIPLEQNAFCTAALQIGLYLLISFGLLWLIQGPFWWGQYHTFWPFDSQHMGVVYERLGRRGTGNSLKLLLHIIGGPDFGLLWTAPIIPLGLLAAYPSLMRLFHGIRRPWRIPIVIFHIVLIYGVSFYQVMKWRTQASYYGYRYLTACLVPSALFAAIALERWCAKRAGFRRLAAGFALFWIMVGAVTAIPFEGNATTLTLAVGQSSLAASVG